MLKVYNLFLEHIRRTNPSAVDFIPKLEDFDSFVKNSKIRQNHEKFEQVKLLVNSYTPIDAPKFTQLLLHIATEGQVD
jgi:hypothetical protein